MVASIGVLGSYGALPAWGAPGRLLFFFFALLLFICIALVGIYTGDRFRCLGPTSSLFLLWGRFLTS